MKISVSTLKRQKVYSVLYADNPEVTGLSLPDFVSSVEFWAHSYFRDILSIYVNIERDTYSMIIVLNVNTDHEEPQFEEEIDYIPAKR